MITENAELYNVAELVSRPGDDGKDICRIPLDLRDKLNERAQACSMQAAGCELRFNLEGNAAQVTLEMLERPAIAEVYCGSFLVGWHIIDTAPTVIPIARPERHAVLARIPHLQSVPFSSDLFRVALPWRPPVRVHAIKGDLTPPRPDQVPDRRYLAYGSSITHGNSSVGATGGYAMRTARRLGVDLINLGFGGGAHCEPEMADYIAARTDWDFATLELGINMVTWLETADFAERVAYFVSTIARAHPDKWVVCIDMFPFYMDFDLASERNHAYRAVVRETVAELALPKLLHLDGRDLLRDVAGLCADAVHPAPAGMDEISVNLAQRLQRTMAS